MPAIQKRLLPWVDGQVIVGEADLVTGDEVYGVLPPLEQLRAGGRLGAQVVGLARVKSVEPHESEVLPWMGEEPEEGTWLILLGAGAEERLEIEVVVSGGIDPDKRVEEIQEILSERGLGGVKVRRGEGDAEEIFGKVYALGGF